ncbi:UNVERIFIED_CONTAM: hypothetical protein Slati_3062100 [Sesamum latifolium]|uniref:UBN2_3 domain-containing protein n=1 Tax=Sesamum latifolium TaxID=2727402 RepID=A0AAW2UVA2_9LAMI
MILETNKFNGMNYNDWLRNLRIVLDLENQTYDLDKSLPVNLPEGSTPKERVTFERWHEDNWKVRNIVLVSMTNDIQKQYDKHDDVASIMLSMNGFPSWIKISINSTIAWDQDAFPRRKARGSSSWA